jgi:hypothetical protein
MIVGIPLVFALLSEYFHDVIHSAETKALKQFGKDALHSYVRRCDVFVAYLPFPGYFVFLFS